MRIAIQGEAGSFSHEAALSLHPGADIHSCAVSVEVFESLLSGQVDAAVIPIENSLAGPVAEHYDLLLSSAVWVERESLLRIRHNLVGAPQSPGEEHLSLEERIGKLQRVYSHPVALAQCRQFFLRHPNLQSTPAYDTAGSVKRLLGSPSGGQDEAAIASAQAASLYGGEILAAGIEDNSENFTRFFVVRRQGEGRLAEDADKVSVAFSVENRPGSLVAALGVFAESGTNLTKIESRPVHGQPWQYIFYVDYQLSSPAGPDQALQRLRAHCSMVRELGRYRTAQRPG
ncbi:MAG TPA: prephenate dehydratase domain-containing protein [Acidisarcina sp.]